MGKGAFQGKEVVLAASGRAGDIVRQGWAGKKGDCFSAREKQYGRPCTRWEVARVWRL